MITLAYDASKRLTAVRDPNTHTTTVAYDAAERASTITRPDSTDRDLRSLPGARMDELGHVGKPRRATLLAEARASYTDPNTHTTDIRPDWGGLGRRTRAPTPAAT